MDTDPLENAIQYHSIKFNKNAFYNIIPCLWRYTGIIKKLFQ